MKTETAKHSINTVNFARKASNCVQGDTLVFSVLDDLRLFGGEALDGEYETRDYDPYTLYKQRLAETASRKADQAQVRDSA